MAPKILIIIDTARIGGPGKGILQLLRHATNRDFTYILCTFKYPHPKSEEFIEEAKRAKLNVILLPQSWRFDPSPVRQVFRVIREHNCDLIQTHGYKGHLIALAVSRLVKIPWVAFAHGWTDEDWKVRLYQKIEMWSLRFPEIVATVSPALFAEISRRRGSAEQTRLIFNAVERGSFPSEEAAPRE